MARTVVIVHPGSLGDVLLAVPAMKRLRGRFPRHECLLVAKDPVGRLLYDLRLIHAWRSLDGPAGCELFNGCTTVPGVLTHWLEHCDVAVAWMQDREGAIASGLRNCGVREVRIQSPFCSDLKARHQSDRFLEILGLPADDGSIEWSERIPSHLLELGRSCLDRVGVQPNQSFVLVHPGSGSIHKCVNPDVLAPVIEQFRQDGKHPLLVEGPADGDVVACLLKRMAVRSAVLRDLNLSLLAGVIAQAELFLGHDSGVTHLSSLLGVPTVALFGPTNPDRWAPRSNQVTVLRTAPCLCSSWEAVQACAEKPCLAVPVEQLIGRCRAYRADSTTPRNPSQCALSPPIPCARVAS